MCNILFNGFLYVQYVHFDITEHEGQLFFLEIFKEII